MYIYTTMPFNRTSSPIGARCWRVLARQKKIIRDGRNWLSPEVVDASCRMRFLWAQIMPFLRANMARIKDNPIISWPFSIATNAPYSAHLSDKEKSVLRFNHPQSCYASLYSEPIIPSFIYLLYRSSSYFILPVRTFIVAVHIYTRATQPT